MKPHIQKQVDALGDMTVAELREKYAEVFHEATNSNHKGFLRKRITWRLQANEEGGLSERARRRAEELANDADLRLLAPKARKGRTVVGRFAPSHDRRLLSLLQIPSALGRLTLAPRPPPARRAGRVRRSRSDGSPAR